MPDTHCIICGESKWVALPNVGVQSMASDWQTIDEPLAKFGCHSCGLVVRIPSTAVNPTLFERGYNLYARPPGNDQERARQSAYAAWIARAVGTIDPHRILDVGCGNGSLLLALRKHWPSATLSGCDVSTESVNHGMTKGLNLWQGTAESLTAESRADMVVSVNVIEHTVDPWMFVKALKRAVAPQGRLVLIWPDGARPGIELLVVDHLYSLTYEHLLVLLSDAGLAVDHAGLAPPELGAFQMVIARARPVSPLRTVNSPVRLIEDKEEYLRRWLDLDAQLLRRFGDREAVCFGIGETAGLLRAYAPTVWQRVQACTADSIVENGRFGSLPVVSLEALPREQPLLVAVRPQEQGMVAERLSNRFHHVITWYDLVLGEKM